MHATSNVKYKVHGYAVVAMTAYFSHLFNGSISLNKGTQTPTSDCVQAIWNASADLDP